MHTKKILIIDNAADFHVTVALMQRRIKKVLGLDAECSLFNPVDKAFMNPLKEIDFAKSLEHLKKTYLNDKLDVVGCDFNLDDKNKSLAIEIVKLIRTYNSSCTLFMYSGGMSQALQHFLNSEGKKNVERVIRGMLSSGIDKIVNGRQGAVTEAVLKLIQIPSMALQVENFLLEHGTKKMENSYPSFENLTLAEVAREIRMQSPAGSNYLKEIIENGLHHMIDLNS